MVVYTHIKNKMCVCVGGGLNSVGSEYEFALKTEAVRISEISDIQPIHMILIVTILCDITSGSNKFNYTSLVSSARILSSDVLFSLRDVIRYKSGYFSLCPEAQKAIMVICIHSQL